VALLDILHYPDERLKQISLPVEIFDDALRAFIGNLEETMRAGPGGVGIAAPQVGRFQRIAIVDISGMKKPPKGSSNHGRLMLINPEITEWEGMVMGREGCMSVPDYTGNVIRAERIRLSAHDEFGQSHTYECEGYEARAVQHEVDHLDGLLFMDRLVSRRTDLFQRKVYKKKDAQ
jgi:peptide deformylase